MILCILPSCCMVMHETQHMVGTVGARRIDLSTWRQTGPFTLPSRVYGVCTFNTPSGIIGGRHR